jgi:hypothetical protein
MIVKRAKSICIYGATGTRKTTNIGRFARYIHESTGKITRLVTAEGGNLEPVSGEIEDGILEVAYVSEHKDLLGILRALSRGRWPQEVDKKLKFGAPNLEGVGAYAVEGITTFSLLMLRHLANEARKINEEVVGQFSEGVEVGLDAKEAKFSAPARSHYGFVQNAILDIIQDFSALPVSRVLFTAHEGKGQDDFSKQLIYGPAAVGKAATSAIPPYLGDLFHLDYEEQPGKEPKVFAYFKPHPDPQTKVLWPAKVRLRPEAIPTLDKQFPGGKLELTLQQGIDTYLRFQDSLSKEKEGGAESRDGK